jgi:methylmalonyl-CoA mutase
VERLTYELAKRAWSHIREIESAGGMTTAIEAGIPKLRIEEAAARTQARIDSGKQPVIGVNKYPPEREEPIEVRKVDNSAVRVQQIAKLERLRRDRDETALRSALERLTAAGARALEGKRAPGLQENLLQLAIEAARTYATVGEISGTQWMLALVRERLLVRLRNDPSIRSRILSLQDEMRRGEITATCAVEQLLAELERSASKHCD